MTSPNNLEIRGNLSEHPLAELLVEAAEARLSGSFRLIAGGETQKTIVYLRDGAPVFAVSNARRHRLFEALLQSGRLTKEQITEIEDFANDQALGAALVAAGRIDAAELERLWVAQIEEIIKSAFGWTEGEWVFSPLVRIKDGIAHRIEIGKLLWEHARGLSSDKIVRRFRSFQESFGLKPAVETPISLLPEEAFLLSRFEKSFLKIRELVSIGGLPEATIVRTLYVLWLGGYLFRQNWNAAFPERKVAAIHAARLSVKRGETESLTPETEISSVAATSAAPPSPPSSSAEAEKQANAEPPPPTAEFKFQKIKEEIFRPPGTERQSRTSAAETGGANSSNFSSAEAAAAMEERRRLETYLKRVEESVTLYEMLGVEPRADKKEIKTTYFALAKRFHPDLFHKDSGTETHRRVQSAFTEIAHAYEVLKDDATREIYDYKNREKLADPAAAKKSKTAASSAAKSAATPEGQAALAKESFEQGYSYLIDGEFENALPLLARAVHLAPDNARYHAFYGKLLAADEKSAHKAESEMQTAVKLDPNNSVFRLMLAEFYAEMKLYRRAEGELQRLLAMFPNNREARQLLDSLPKK